MKGNNMKTFEQLKAQLDAAVEACIWVPNALLPERYQENRTGGSTLERVNRIYDAEILPSIEFRQVQADKAERVAKYAKQYEAEGKFDYDVNEHKQYHNEQSFCSGLIKAGLLDSEDLE
jgi:hypothetical protein